MELNIIRKRMAKIRLELDNILNEIHIFKSKINGKRIDSLPVKLLNTYEANTNRRDFLVKRMDELHKLLKEDI